MTVDLDPKRLDQFERHLLASTSVRVDAPKLWRALAKAFPHRSSGPPERRLLLAALRALEARGLVQLPAARGRRWDRSMDPAVPTSIDLVREQPSRPSFPWRTFPWHPHLHWVPRCRTLSTQQIEFLRRVHEGFVNGTFREPAPLKYRSLQLTGDEKLLESLVTTSLFAAGRLTLAMLACLPDALPLAWEPVGDGGRMLVFENAGPFAVARRVLGELATRPYDLVAYGGGRSVLAALEHIKVIDRRVVSIHYVGDLDQPGLEIALAARKRSADLGLPIIEVASELHLQMLVAAEAFGHPNGWSGHKSNPGDRDRVLGMLSADVRGRIGALLEASRRIPEEILGPDEFRAAWGASKQRARCRE